VTVNDTPEQTKAVLLGIADTDDDEDEDFDLDAWHALQRWLEPGDCRVTIPYRRKLAELVPPSACAARRDFKALLTLIKAHALLHQAARDRDGRGRIVACHEDYAEVRRSSSGWCQRRRAGSTRRPGAARSRRSRSPAGTAAIDST
jgi:hypothetical protein